MTRRLVVAIVGLVAGALVVAGFGTLLLVRVAARTETRHDLEEQVEALAPLFLDATRAQRLGAETAARPVLESLRRALRLQGFETLVLAADGTVVNGTPPEGVTFDANDVAIVRAGGVVSGADGSRVYAAALVGGRAPARRAGEGASVLVATRESETGLALGGRWFVVASVLTLAAAVAIAATLGRRFTQPIRAADDAARRITSGDLAARVPVTKADDELAALARSLNAMAAELERARGMERQFLLSVSHELRTPLTSIQGFAEAIAEGAATDHQHAAGIITAEARRLERLVRDLLDLARLDARTFSLDLRATDAAEVVGETAEGFRPAADAAGVALDLSAVQIAPAVQADPDRLAQVVANLVENALKFAASSIRVGVAGHDGRTTIWVDDDGPGIAADDVPHVFDRLYTASRTPARQSGTGLGLAVVRELTEAMGGQVRAERLEDTGTRVVVTLRDAPTSSSSL